MKFFLAFLAAVLLGNRGLLRVAVAEEEKKEEESCIPFPEDLNNASRVRRKTRFLGGLNTTVPVYYLNANARKNEDKMMVHLLSGAPTILGEENHPYEDLSWPTKFTRIEIPEAVPDELKENCYVKDVCKEIQLKVVAHYLAWQKALEDTSTVTSQVVLILEDDVMPVLPGVWEYTIEQVIEQMDKAKPEWKALRLFIPSHNHPYLNDVVNGWKLNFGEVALPVPRGATAEGGASAYLIKKSTIQDLIDAGKGSSEPCPQPSQLCLEDTAASIFARLPETWLRSIQMFAYNPVASDRSMRRVTKDPEGRNRYSDFVLVTQQNVENDIARKPAPGNVTEMLPQWNDLWRPKF